MAELLQRSHVQRRVTTYRNREIVRVLVDAHREVFLSIVGKNPDEADRRLREHFAIGDELRRRSLIESYRSAAEAHTN
jgi:DNA-binding GntR family transcriptional regulator